ncbi:MAG: peptidyl-prolyl cis-trans isomerase [bacterium]|nr:peptidyl-prolyl cis-trans isomerase [bacterium]
MPSKILKSASLCTKIIVPLLLVAPIWAQDAGATAATPVDEAVSASDEQTSIFGEPLIVNGTRISDTAIKRFLCYGKGRNGLESLRLGLLMDQERELRAIKARDRMLEDNYGGKMPDELSADQKQELDAALTVEMSRFDLDPKEYEIRYQKEANSFKERYPTLDLPTEIRRAYKSMDWWQDQIRMTMEFDQLFFPGHPDGWPDLSLEAVHGASPEFDLVEDYIKWYLLRLENWNEGRGEAQVAALAEHFDGADVDSLNDEQRARLKGMVDEVAGAFVPREDDMMMAVFRDAVQAMLAEFVVIKTASEGLPEDTLMTIEGHGLNNSLTTEQVWQDMKDAFNSQDVYEAKLFLALHAATRDRMDAEGILNPIEPFMAKMAEQRAASAGAGTFGSQSFVAVSAYRFPSVESFQDYSYLMESFRDSIEERLAMREDGSVPQELVDHFPIVQGIMGIAKVQAETLLVSAFDEPNNAWIEGGWDLAYDRAMALRAEIDAYHAKLEAQDVARAQAEVKGITYTPTEKLQPFDVWWARYLDLNSDFWDPPMPASGKMPPANSMRDKGRFQGTPTTRNDMKNHLGESAYSHFLWNNAAVDSIFFDVPQGAIGGPFQGPKGYYITYVKRKVPPTNRLGMKDPRTFQALQDDYTALLFRRYSHESLKQAVVSGLDY